MQKHNAAESFCLLFWLDAVSHPNCSELSIHHPGSHRIYSVLSSGFQITRAIEISFHKAADTWFRVAYRQIRQNTRQTLSPWLIMKFAQGSRSRELTKDGIWIFRANPETFLVIHSWQSITKTCCFWFLPVRLHSSPCDASTWKTQRDNFMMGEIRQ